jgi:signal transduction histidine kinase/DNA-binding response OmpR family regulator
MADTGAVLVIDDDREIAGTLREFIEFRGYPVVVAHTGRNGLAFLRHTSISLVLLDLALPDMDGIAVLREAEALPEAPEIIIITGNATLESAMAAVGPGAVGYLAKPLDLHRLGGVVERVMAQRRAVRENQRLQRQLADRLKQSEALLAISRTITSTLDLREALRQICRELVRLVGADTGAAYLLDSARDELQPFAGYRVPPEMVETFLSSPLPFREQGFHVALWRDRGAVVSDDVANDPRFSYPLFRAFPHQSGLVLPLVLDDEVAGAFYLVWWKARRGFPAHEIALLESVAGQVAVLLRNVRLFEGGERERRRLDALYAVARRLSELQQRPEILSFVVEEACRLLGAEAAGIRLLDGDSLIVGARTESAAALMDRDRIPVGESFSGHVVETAQALILSDIAADERFQPAQKKAVLALGYNSCLGVPLVLQGHAFGVLTVYSKAPRHFKPDDVALLAALADQTSQAVHKSGLLAEAASGRAVLERLYQFAIAMQEPLAAEARVRTFIAAARDAIGFDRCHLFLVTDDGGGLRLETGLPGGEQTSSLTLPLTPAAGPYWDAVQRRRAIAVLGKEDGDGLTRMDPVFVGDPTFHSPFFVLAPLVVGDRVIGVAAADNKLTRRPIPPESVGWFNLLCQSFAMAVDASQLDAERRRREQEAKKLYEVTRDLSANLDLDRVLGEITRKTLELLGCDASGMFMYDSEQGGLTLRRGVNLDLEAYREFVIRPGEGIAGRAFQSRIPIWTRDRLDDPRLTYTSASGSLIQERAPRASLAVPILAGDGILGVLVEHFYTVHSFTPEEIQLLSTLAGHAAIALNNASLYEEVRLQQTRLAQILDSTSDGMMLVGGDGRIEAVNRRAAEMLEVEVEGTIGTTLAPLLERFRTAVPDFDAAVAPLLALAALPDRPAQGDLDLRAFKRTVHWTAQPTRSEAGAAIGFTLTFHDVTQEREVSRMKSDFVSFVTHQLRTPLAGIKWMLELTSKEPDVPPDAQSYVQDAREAAQRLIHLVNELLDISRLERGKMVFTPQAVDLGKLTESVLSEVALLVEEKGHRLVFRPDAVPAVVADPQLLRQVVLNLVANAVKYTPPGGDIAIGISQEEATVMWTIRDSGVGVPKAAQARLFEKFFRADNVVTMETEGTGLGLYLVRLIMEQLDGRVWCTSGEGQGATFAFSVPVAA